MLNQITLKKFRQHDDKTVVFGAGNVVLRGGNEAGKSTIIEGLMYLMGGTRCCRNSDFVQWGAKPGECKVEGLLTFHGTQLRATRGPRGAEVYVPADAKEPMITGQSEVTAFFAEQMGASMDIAANMMFAGQKEIGGLLDEKNGKVVEFIESMSGLDIVDRLLSKISATGKTGPTQSMRDILETEQQRYQLDQGSDYSGVIKDIEQQLPELEQRDAAARAGMANAREELAGLEQRKKAHDLADAAARAEWAQRNRAADAVTTAEAAVTQAKFRAEQSRGISLIDAELERVDEQRQVLTGRAEIGRVHAKFLAYKAPEDVWEGGAESLDAEIASTERSIDSLKTEQASRRQAVANQRNQIAAHRANVVEVGKKCRSCGQMIPDAAGAEEHNKAELESALVLERGIEALESAAAALDPQIEEERENLAVLRSVRSQQPFPLAAAHPDLFSVDLGFYPPAVAWVGGEVKDAAPEIAELTKLATALRAERDAVRDAHAGLENAQKNLERAQAAMTAANERCALAKASEALLDEATIEALEAGITQAHALMAQEQRNYTEATVKLAEQREALKGARAAQKAHAERLERAQETITRLQEDIRLQEFHNDLTTALRRARPQVANQLWNMILKGVSTYLTKMRGEASIVQRVDKTFTINDKPYDSYSGSALDLLALGIRIGLAKVFVPHADMLILDEPFSACSEERTMQCLSFTAAAGFGQTIVITHEDSTESVFDTIVEV